ncbi:hypothetical protein E4P35_14975 [Thiopseudomonas sp. 4R-3cl]|nr:hypothetical protein E4P35_14975 [Thiopseudomonas sp. 4R-3cl]
MSWDWVQNYLFEFGVITTVGYLFKSSANMKKEYKATQAGVKALLRDRLISAIHKAKEQGFVYIYELDNITQMYKEYTNLGGNGSIRHMMNEVSKLPTKTKVP